MANSLSQPRTVFHRRLQGINDRLEALTKTIEVRLPPDREVEGICKTSVSVIIGDNRWDIGCIDASKTVYEAVEVMRKRNLKAVFIQERQQIIGMITCAGVLWAVETKNIYAPVKNFMICKDEKEFVCVTTTDTVETACGLFQQCRVKRLIVVDNNKNVMAVLTLGMLFRWLKDKLDDLRSAGKP